MFDDEMESNDWQEKLSDWTGGSQNHKKSDEDVIAECKNYLVNIQNEVIRCVEIKWDDIQSEIVETELIELEKYLIEHPAENTEARYIQGVRIMYSAPPNVSQAAKNVVVEELNYIVEDLKKTYVSRHVLNAIRAVQNITA